MRIKDVHARQIFDSRGVPTVEARVVLADGSFGVIDYVVSQMKQSELIEQEYVDPKSVSITFPKEKRNLITIYIESAETSSQDKENGGFFDVNYTPEMTRIAKENVSFSHSSLIEGAAVAPACGWTNGMFCGCAPVPTAAKAPPLRHMRKN